MSYRPSYSNYRSTARRSMRRSTRSVRSTESRAVAAESLENRSIAPHATLSSRSTAMSSVASSNPSTAATQISLSPGGDGAGDATTERLTFAFQLREMVVLAPAKQLAHHSYYIKWERGRSFKGKLHPVACPTRLHADGVHVVVPLPMTHQFTFEVGLHQKHNDTSQFEKKVMDITVDMLRYADENKDQQKSRTNVAVTKIDLRTLMNDVRVNVSTKARLPLSDHEYIDCSFIIAPAGAPLPAFERASTASASRLTLSVGRGSVSELRFEECESTQSSLVAQETMQKHAEATGAKGLFSSLADVMDKGVSKSVVVDKPLSETFTTLAGNGVGEFGNTLHSVRGDQGYNDAPWTMAPVGSVARKSVPYQMRFGKEKLYRCQEETVMAAVGNEIFVHSSSKAPDVPLIGDSCNLEFVMHLCPVEPSEPEAGTIVAMYSYLPLSGMLKRAAGDRVQLQLERLVLTAEQVILQIMNPRASKRGTLKSHKFRNSLSSRSIVTQSSLDPNLWRRLMDHCTLPHPHLILQYLNRLQQGVIPKVTEQHINTLESVLVYHRQTQIIVEATCVFLHRLTKVATPAVIVTYSPTLAESMRSVFDLYEPSTFGRFESLLMQLEKEGEAAQQSRQTNIARERNYWHVVRKNIWSVEIVDQCLGLIIDSRSSILTSEHLQMLCGVLSLHMSNERIAQLVFQVISGSRSQIEISGQLADALNTAARVHPSLSLRFPILLEKAADAASELSSFQRKFGSFIPEKPAFECHIVFSKPTWGTATLYLTRNFICFGDYSYPTSTLRRVVCKRVALQPAVAIHTTMTGIEDFVFVVWSRHELLQKLSDFGFFSIIQK